MYMRLLRTQELRVEKKIKKEITRRALFAMTKCISRISRVASRFLPMAPWEVIIDWDWDCVIGGLGQGIVSRLSLELTYLYYREVIGSTPTPQSPQSSFSRSPSATLPTLNHSESL